MSEEDLEDLKHYARKRGIETVETARFVPLRGRVSQKIVALNLQAFWPKTLTRSIEEALERFQTKVWELIHLGYRGEALINKLVDQGYPHNLAESVERTTR